MSINRAKDMFYSHFDRSIQVLVECFENILGSFGGNISQAPTIFLVKCRSHAILSFFVASVFLINLLALTFSKYLADIWNFNCSRINHQYLDADFKFQVSLPSLLGNNTKAFDSFGRNYHQL